jgi:GR25 family glycosyltransferase involved in LPS biosynthesis
VSIGVAVVAHESRRKAANELAERVDVNANLVSFDNGTLGCEGNHLRVLRTLALTGFDWCVILEDDAEPVDDFRFHVKHALAHTPGLIVGLYLGTGNPSGQPQRQIRAATIVAARHNYAWITADCLIGSVGYVIRTSLIADMLPTITARMGELPLRISRWAQDWGVKICYTVPSLVNHADAEPIGHPPGQPRSIRRAWSYGTRENWDTPAVPLGHCNEWSQP